MAGGEMGLMRLGWQDMITELDQDKSGDIDLKEFLLGNALGIAVSVTGAGWSYASQDTGRGG